MDPALKLPQGYTPRPDLLDQIQQALLDMSRTPRVWLHGLPGFGKTTLAKAIAHDENIRSAFADGISFFTLGQQPNHVEAMVRICKDLGVAVSDNVTEHAASTTLATALQSKRCLLVLDDVWSDHHLDPYDVDGTALLITSRKPTTSLDPMLGIKIVEMKREQSLGMLQHFLGEQHVDLDELAKSLHDWPILLWLAGRQLRTKKQRRSVTGSEAFGFVREDLAHLGLTAFDIQNAVERRHAVRVCIEASLADANNRMRRRCYAMGIFPEDVDVPLGVLETVWELNSYDTRKLAEDFDDRGLLVLDQGVGVVHVHDALRDYYNGNLSDDERIRLHGQLIDAWGADPPNEYKWRHFRYHALNANRRATFRARILNFAWAFEKMKAVGLPEVLSDYDEFSDDDDAQLIAMALRASAHAVQDDGDQLPSQILGRLPEGRVEEFRTGALKGPGKTWLMPVRPTLEQAGGALTRTLQLSSSPYAIALRNDHEIIWAGGERLGSLGGSGTLDFDTGEIHALPWYWKQGGHSPKSFFFCRDGRTLMYAFPEKLLVFDLETGKETERPAPWPESVSASAAAKTVAISVTAHGELLLWDIESGKILGRHQVPGAWTIHQP